MEGSSCPINSARSKANNNPDHHDRPECDQDDKSCTAENLSNPGSARESLRTAPAGCAVRRHGFQNSIVYDFGAK